MCATTAVAGQTRDASKKEGGARVATFDGTREWNHHMMGLACIDEGSPKHGVCMNDNLYKSSLVPHTQTAGVVLMPIQHGEPRMYALHHTY